MRIVVCVKQVYDPETVKISRSREELDLRDTVKIFNPPDESRAGGGAAPPRSGRRRGRSADCRRAGSRGRGARGGCHRC